MIDPWPSLIDYFETLPDIVQVKEGSTKGKNKKKI